jgi:nucleoid-associated protein YgaU
MTASLLDAIPQPSHYPRTSRYYGTPVSIYTAPDGTQVPYLARRLLPQPGSSATITQYTVVAGDRADLLAFRFLGDAGQWWQIADANPVLDPRELTATPGRRIRITLPPGIPAGTAA